MKDVDAAERLDGSLARLRTEFLGRHAVPDVSSPAAGPEDQPALAHQVGRISQVFGALRSRWMSFRRS